MVIKSILSLIDFSPDGKVNYELQSPHGQLLINERALLTKLNIKGLFSYYGEDGIGGIVTLGNINIVQPPRLYISFVHVLPLKA